MFRYRHFGNKIGSKAIIYTEWQDMTIPVHDMIVSYNRFCEVAENVDVEYKDVTLVKDLMKNVYYEAKFQNGRKIDLSIIAKYLNREALIKNNILVVL